MMQPNDGLRKAAFAVVFAAIIVVVILLARANARYFERTIVTQNQEHLLTLAKSEAIHIEAFISDIQDKLRMLALNPKIKEVITRGHRLKKISTIDEYFAGKASTIYATDARGTVKYSLPYKDMPGGDYSANIGVKTVIKSHQPYTTGLLKTKSKQKFISVCYPVFKNKKFVGVLAALIRLDAIPDCLKDSRVGAEGYAWMIDQTRIVVSHPEPDYVGKNIIATMEKLLPDHDWLELENIIAKMISGQAGVGSYYSVGWQDEKPRLTRRLAAFAPVRIGDHLWSTAVSMDYDDISGLLNTQTRNIFVGAEFLILIFVGTGIGLFKLHQKKVLLEVQTESAEKLRSINKQLESEITERKNAENALRKAKEQAERAGAEIQQINRNLKVSIERANLLAEEAMAADRAKSEFLANMSHELRTPLNSILGFSELLTQEELMAEQKEWLDTINASGQSLLALIEDILDFSKIEAGKLDIKIIECSLEKILAEVDSLLRPQATKKGLEFKVLPCAGLPAIIRTDPARLHQCLINLVNNAIKFTKSGYVHLLLSLEERGDSSFIRFDVADTGIGISPDDQQLIFESFSQADCSSTRKYGGTGLGLAITKRLAELLGGEVVLRSELGKGSVFSLIIPSGVDAQSAAPLQKDSISAQGQGHNKFPQQRFTGRVLVAEDNHTNQQFIELLLQKMGLETMAVADGRQAVDKATRESFDLILMDIQMPNMNGYEATKTLREKNVTTPIIALTAHAMVGDAEKCIEAGCDDYLPKPFDQQQLYEIMAKYLQQTSSKSSQQVPASAGPVNIAGA
ncbi:MAG: response regulator [Actinobacteria bacterium]|nr:response regulator [Actinomycetota bacterium]